ncbi:MAG: DUF1549 domain-containing protein [Planctomycetaceae bacterium]
MRLLSILAMLVVTGVLYLMVVQAGHITPAAQAPAQLAEADRIDHSVARINAWFRRHWADEGLQPAELADDLTVFRRLSLALHGTVPSLEEIRTFSADSSKDRVERWLTKMLEDSRFGDYFAERLARTIVGTQGGAFVVYRRDRLTDWLGEQLLADRPWPEITRELITAEGLWTDHPASNFITSALVDGEGIDENKLAGKTVRAFLGQRIDCAQCHNHPFDTWQQQDFEGLAAFFGQARVTPGGAVDRTREDEQPVEYEVIDPGSEVGRLVKPRVPFHDDWLPTTGTRREQLAGWVVHPENRRFERAIANRIWGLMFGRPYHDPVDDLPHPKDGEADPDLLDILGAEYRANGESLRFLVRMIGESDAFRLRSDAENVEQETYDAMSDHWAVFPVVRLRPEQVIGSMFQAAHVRTIDQNSNLFVRFRRLLNENDFLKEYGDLGEDELLQQTGTIPQALLRMNGKFTRELTQAEAFSAAGQIAQFSPDDESLVTNCFLTCLTRLPAADELRYFAGQLAEAANPDGENSADHADDQAAASREETIRDLYWVLFNSPEFSWNH